MNVINVDDKSIKDFLYNEGSTWKFNPPHSSHMGGVWERLIGVTRRILDSLLLDMNNKELTHEVLVTLMAEVSAIINSRPLVPVSSDPECPTVLSPSMLLTQKTDVITDNFNVLETKDLYKAQWKRVQVLADMFWNRWKRDYLQTLQVRRKWQHSRPNLKEGDVILLKDNSVHRNEWPLGVIVRPINSEDGIVRKALVRVIKEGKPTIYTRPITEMVLLLSDN